MKTFIERSGHVPGDERDAVVAGLEAEILVGHVVPQRRCQRARIGRAVLVQVAVDARPRSTNFMSMSEYSPLIGSAARADLEEQRIAVRAVDEMMAVRDCRP